MYISIIIVQVTSVSNDDIYDMEKWAQKLETDEWEGRV